MGKKNDLNLRNEEESDISKILQGAIYTIDIQGHDRTDYSKQSMDIAIWADKWSQDIIHKLNRIIQTELGYITNLMGHKDKFSGTCNLLLQNFYKEFLKKEDLEKSIENKIKNLEEYKFWTPKSLYEHYEIEDEYEELPFENVKDLLKSLRKRRIKIYEELLKDFLNNKDVYLDFMKSQDYTYT